MSSQPGAGPDRRGGGVTPPGWPSDLPGPGDPAFADKVTGWLLDRCPAGFRSHPVVRRQPRALARIAVRHAEATLTGLRETFATARAELSGQIPPESISEVLVAIEAEGHRAAAGLREVRLVEEALQGRVWRPRM